MDDKELSDSIGFVVIILLPVFVLFFLIMVFE